MSRLLTEDEAGNFKKIIDNYQPNNEVLEQFKASNFVVIAGPAGAGKDTLRNNLTQKYPELYLPILSTTTRPPRRAEADGHDYHFCEIEEVQEGLAKREFFQVALVHGQQVSCLHINELKKLQLNQHGLSILIPFTERELRTIKSDIKTVFLIPPSLEILKQRIQSERLLDEAEIARRLEAALKEMKQAIEIEQYYCLITDTIAGVAQKTHQFLQSNQWIQADNSAARQAMKQIVLELSHAQ